MLHVMCKFTNVSDRLGIGNIFVIQKDTEFGIQSTLVRLLIWREELASLRNSFLIHFFFLQRMRESLQEVLHIASRHNAIDSFYTFLSIASTHCYRVRRYIAIVCVDTLQSYESSYCYRLRQNIAIASVNTLLSSASPHCFRQRRHIAIV